MPVSQTLDTVCEGAIREAAAHPSGPRCPPASALVLEGVGRGRPSAHSLRPPPPAPSSPPRAPNRRRPRWEGRPRHVARSPPPLFQAGQSRLQRPQLPGPRAAPRVPTACPALPCPPGVEAPGRAEQLVSGGRGRTRHGAGGAEGRGPRTPRLRRPAPVRWPLSAVHRPPLVRQSARAGGAEEVMCAAPPLPPQKTPNPGKVAVTEWDRDKSGGRKWATFPGSTLAPIWRAALRSGKCRGHPSQTLGRAQPPGRWLQAEAKAVKINTSSQTTASRTPPPPTHTSRGPLSTQGCSCRAQWGWDHHQVPLAEVPDLDLRKEVDGERRDPNTQVHAHTHAHIRA
ncbi:hypothetical protein J1605_017269 [Eschrichtius robustus]|uniref:Uncharacterized protein n=1 Tax=Eschrichtius robustus TaxID=9764 RepID=A0AB34HXK1_ESCRO|nr:hypothetical protein J1605_017269 [Eschrichtius robustus]